MSLPRSRSRNVASTAVSYRRRSGASLAKISLRHFGGKKDAGGRLGRAWAPSRSIAFRSSIAANTGSCGSSPSSASRAASVRPSRQELEGPLTGAHQRGKSDPLQHRGGGEEHVRGPQMGEHRRNDRLAAIGRPGGIRAHLEAGAPIGQPETAEMQALLQFEQMLAAGLVSARWAYSPNSLGRNNRVRAVVDWAIWYGSTRCGIACERC